MFLETDFMRFSIMMMLQTRPIATPKSISRTLMFLNTLTNREVLHYSIQLFEV